MEGQSQSDIVRQRIVRQNPRLLLSSVNKNNTTVKSKNMNAEDGIHVRNRFQHSRKRSLSSTISISGRNPLYKLNIDTDNSELPQSTKSGSDRQPVGHHGLSRTDCNNTHTHPKPDFGSGNNCILDNSRASSPLCVIERMPNCGTASILQDENWCKTCKSSDSVTVEDTKKLCKKCGTFSFIKGDANVPLWPAKDFYHQEEPRNEEEERDRSLQLPVSHGEASNISNETKAITKTKQIAKPGRQTKLTFLTISSDEEDLDFEKQENKESKCGQSQQGNAMLDSTTGYKIPKFSDRMKKQDNNSDIIARPLEPVISASAKDVAFDLSVGRVQFGCLIGKAISSLTLINCALRLDIECSYHLQVQGENKKTTEKYKLALTSVEVDRILINDDEEPLMICVIPSKCYSDVVNAALTKCVLDPQSDIPIKNQMMFVIDHDPAMFKEIINHHMDSLLKISMIHKLDCHESAALQESLQADAKGGKAITRAYHTRNKAHAKSAIKQENLRTMFVYPPPPSFGGIAITTEDIKCLDPGTYLNDTIIDFYLRYLVEEKLSSEVKEKTYLFNTYFYTRLKMKVTAKSDKSLSPADRMHLQVKKWTRNVDIFEKDYIIIPVNEHSHWFLVIICFPSLAQDVEEADCAVSETVELGTDEVEELQSSDATEPTCFLMSSSVDEMKQNNQEDSSDLENVATNNFGQVDKSGKKQPCILIFDSLVSGGRSRVFTNLRQYLTTEWKEKRGKTHADKIFDKKNLKGSFPKIPLQNNDCDCGVYVLQFAESFFESPILNFKPPIKKEDWFTKNHVEKKRDNIRELICQLEEKYVIKQTNKQIKQIKQIKQENENENVHVIENVLF